MRAVRNFVQPVFYGITDTARFNDGFRAAVSSVNPGVFAADNLVTFGRNLGFLGDEKFIAAFNASAKDATERATLWRTQVLVWAASHGLRRDGDFVECGCYRGTSARIVAEYLDFAATGRRFYLYDLFEHNGAATHHAMPAHGKDLRDTVVARFADMPNVVVTQGKVPDILDRVAPPGPIAFLHIDMNNAEAETGALEKLFDRVAPGAAIVFDDYGWTGYHDQQLAADAFMAGRGYRVLELPTGQGLVIK